ncbi:MAG: YfhO family protein [Planctomycetia bacterium]|nr:YfhO family protein [Planctomycetia bacterium]
MIRNRTWFFPLFFLSILFLCFFYRLFFCGEVFLERDSFNFYYPLFERISQYWQSGEIPLWDPLENMGQPLLANAAASVFYPFKLIFLIPLPYFILFNIYHLIHFAICLYGMNSLMRSWGFSRNAALFSSMVYTFCGPVLLLNINVIFLVGASWLPLFIKKGSDLLRVQRLSGIVPPALILAMMILGGDPEMALLAPFFLSILALILWKSTSSIENAERKSIKPLFLAGFWILVIVLAASLIAAVQILPSREFARLSDRNPTGNPSSLWEIPSFLLRSDSDSIDLQSQESDDPFLLEPKGKSEQIADGIFCRNLPEDSTQKNVWNFNVHPFHLLEFLSPDLYGRCPLRLNEIYYGEEDRFWNYSLYSGIVPLIFVLSSFCFYRLAGRKSVSVQRSVRIWSTWMFLFLLWGSMGKYGPYWLWRFFLVLLGDVQHLGLNNGDPVGGPYWILMQILPMFSSFRYSGKLMVPALFFFAILAGWGWDHAKKRTLFYWSVSLLFLLLFLTGKHLLKGPEYLTSYFSTFGSNASLVSKKVWFTILSGQILVLSILSIWMIFFLRTNIRKEFFRTKPIQAQKSSFAVRKKPFTVLLLLLVGADLWIANHDLSKTLPVSVCSGEIGFAKRIKEDWRKESGISFPRYFLQESSPDFYSAELIGKDNQEGYHSWRRAALYPKWNSPEKIANIHYTGSMIVREYDHFLQKLNQLPDAQRRECAEWLGSNYLIGKTGPLPGEIPLFTGKDDASSVYIPGEYPQEMKLVRLSNGRDRIRIFHNVQDLFDPKISLFDFMNRSPKDNRKEKEYARFIQYTENKIVFQVHLEEKGELVLSEQYFPGWKATESGKEIPIEKTLGFLRMITLDSGDHTIEMVYAPRSFRYGLILSLLGAMLGISLFIVDLCSKPNH